MELESRQLALLNEFLNSPDRYFTNRYMSSLFHVSFRTVSNDIQTLNDRLRAFDAAIVMVRSHGYHLICSETVLLHLQHQYLCTDTTIHHPRSLQANSSEVLCYLLTNSEPYRVEDIAEYLHCSRRTASQRIHEAKIILQRYRITLVRKPHYGMCMHGDERQIRYCFMDAIFSSREAKTLLDDHEYHNLEQRLISFLKDTQLPLSKAALSKLGILLWISCIRQKQSHVLSFTSAEFQLLHTMSDMPLADDELRKCLGQSIVADVLRQEDYLLARIYLASAVDYRGFAEDPHLPATIKSEALRLEQGVINGLANAGILSFKNTGGFKAYFRSLFLQCAFRSLFSITEYGTDSGLIQDVYQTPLSATIGALCSQAINAMTSCPMGEKVEMDFAFMTYAWIRSTRNLQKKIHIAILTPYSRITGESLKHRVLDRYSNIIESIDVLTYAQALKGNLSAYHAILYFEDELPVSVSHGQKVLKVSYFFTNEDVANFYETIAVPSRKYERAFGPLYQEDYIHGFLYQSQEQLVAWLQSQTGSDSVKEQISKIQLEPSFISNETLNLLVFVKGQENTFSRLLVLRHPAEVDGMRIERIFIHCICIDGSMIRLKTAEKVTRNLTSIIDTDEIILSGKGIDFYNYYIHFQKNALEERGHKGP